jgi:amino acid permease
MSAPEVKRSPAEVFNPEKAENDRALDMVKLDVEAGLYDGLQRNMKQRHVQMIALAGVSSTQHVHGSF